MKPEERTTSSFLCQLTKLHRRQGAVRPEGVQECHAAIVSPGAWGASRRVMSSAHPHPADLKATLTVYFLDIV